MVSPLTRTLETACAIFGEAHTEEEDGGLAEEGEGGAEGRRGAADAAGRRRLLMRHRPAVAGRVAPAPAFSADPDLPFVAHELCREESGLHPCDGRLPTSAKRLAFPGVDFSLVESELDPLYDGARREPKESVKARALAFARWLLERPERHVAVVSHAGFLHFFAQAVGAPHFVVGGGGGGGGAGGAAGSAHAPPQQQQQHGEELTAHLTKWFENAEARIVILGDASGGCSSGPNEGGHARARDPLAFAGGGFEDAEEEDEEKR